VTVVQCFGMVTQPVLRNPVNRIYVSAHALPAMRTSERRLVTESAETHYAHTMQAYIDREAARPCKQWIHEVLAGNREADRVKLRTPAFVLLPDVDSINKRPRRHEEDAFYFWQGVERAKGIHNPNTRKQNLLPPTSFHWLAVVADTRLRTLRDLRGAHIPMLQALHTHCCQKICEEYGVESNQIMAYVHYPPSVYQLHIHFKHLTGHHVFHDTFRVHPLLSIINNLQIDSDFYSKSVLQLPVYVHTDLYAALHADRTQVQQEPHEVALHEQLYEQLHGQFHEQLHGQLHVILNELLQERLQKKPTLNQIEPNLSDPPTQEKCSTTTSPGSTPSTPAQDPGIATPSATSDGPA